MKAVTFKVFTFHKFRKNEGVNFESVPDRRSRDLEVIVVGRAINLGTGDLELGGNGEGVEEGEVSLRVPLDQGVRHPITARRVSK